MISIKNPIDTKIRNTIQQIRLDSRHKRQQITEQQQADSALSLLNKIKLHSAVQAAKNIAIYHSFDSEINTAPIIEYLWQQQKSVYLPIIHPFSKGHLLFIHYDAQTTMIKNSFGFFEPKLDVRNVIPFQQLEIVFTPLVAFDKRNYRIGMGGGYYDRMLANNKYHSNQYTIGLAHRCQQVENIPNQPWDIALNEIVAD